MLDRNKVWTFASILALGVGLMVYGAVELRTTLRLAAEGRATAGQVVHKSIEHGAKGRKSHYLHVQYSTDNGQTFVQRAGVSAARFARTRHGDTVALRYLPYSPEVFALGTTIRPNYSYLIASLVAFLVAGVYYLTNR